MSRFSESKLSALELGQRAPSMFDVAGMCRVYGASRELEEQLIRMSDQADKPGWWEPYSTSMLADFSVLLELEQVCSNVLVYESELIPGLLQTEAYARAVHASGPAFDDEQIEQAVELRSKRQAHFWSRDPLPDVCIIMNESAIARPVCGPGEDDEQADRLTEASAKCDLRILPFDAGAHPSMLGPYLIMGSTMDEISDVVYTETISGGRYEENSDTVAAYRRFFEYTRKTTIPYEEYREMTPGKWRKSSRSGGNGGNCVETRAWTGGDLVEIRDSKAPALGSLAITTADFTALLESVKLFRYAPE